MKRSILIFCFLLLLSGAQAQSGREIKLRLIETSDVHGNYYPYNFITKRAWKGSLARVQTYVEKVRESYRDNLILLDNGDILQGQPSAYYYNYIDTTSVHLCAAMMNELKHDAGNMGNHDVETGRRVFERWIGDCHFPMLGANVVDAATGEPFLKPYVVFEREGVKVVVLGMITPAIPTWLPENLWKGLRFDDMEDTARRWIPLIREKEQPDVIIGLFHAGKEPVLAAGRYRENASVTIAQNVPGFDVVMMGHDHVRACKKVINTAGDSVLVINPANNAFYVGEVDITLRLDKKKVTARKVEGRLVDVSDSEVSNSFMQKFAAPYDDILRFVSKEIGSFSETISTRPSYFGASAFVDFIHELQLELSGADVSFAAPLSFDTQIEKGTITVSDMFNLYKFENLLYVMNLAGAEIKEYLEESYYIWTNQMKSPADHLLWLKKEGATFQHFSYNFDSAAGIIYTVDVTKSKGEKVTILSMADGSPFRMDYIYKVALNSYRGNGGGDLLKNIDPDELKKRLVSSTDRDLRFYLMEHIAKRGALNPQPLNQWKFIPEEWAIPAAKRDYELLFGKQ